MSKRRGASLNATAVGYLSPWAVWLLMLPLALLFGAMASFGQAYAVILGFALAPAGAALTWQTWHAFGPESGRREQERLAATIAFGLAFTWLLAATMFGLFHDPGIALWPEFWNLPKYIGASFTVPVWFSWIFLMAFCSIAFNISRGAKVKRDGDERGKVERETPDELGKILDGSTITVDAIVGKPDAPVIKATMKGVPGKHTGDELMGKTALLESKLGLRPGAIQPARDHTKASNAKLRVMPKDPLTGDLKWKGPQHPGTSIADFPCRPAVYTDGEEVEHWFPGKGVRPLQHLAVAGVNGSGKSMGMSISLVDVLCRIDATVRVADISGKIWQTFGPMMPYLSKVAGLNGIDDAAREQNVLDALGLLLAEETEAMERQQRWGKLGITQWEPRCFTEFGDTFDVIVIDEASELLEKAGEEVERLSKKIRSGGKLLVVMAQRFSWDQIPTTLRAQLPACYVFGQANSGDAGMLLPGDVERVLAKSPAADPGEWGSSTPGKAQVILPGQPVERRGDPCRFYWATNEELAAYLEAYGRRLWSEQEIEAMKNDDPPAGILVRTNASGNVRTKGAGPKRPRTYASDEDDVRTNDANVHDGDVRDSRTYEDEGARTYVEGDERTYASHVRGDVRAESVYTDPELEEIAVDIDGPIECPEGMDVPMAQSGYEGGDESRTLPQDEFRTLVQQHLAALLAQDQQEVRPADVLKLQPPAGTRQRILAELKRLEGRGAEGEYTVTRSETSPGHWHIRAPRALAVTVS